MHAVAGDQEMNEWAVGEVEMVMVISEMVGGKLVLSNIYELTMAPHTYCCSLDWEEVWMSVR